MDGDNKPSQDALSLLAQLPHVPELPDYGWRVPFSYQCKMKCSPFSKPRLKQIPQYVGLGLRYTKFWLGKKRQGRRPFIDQIRTTKHKPIYGCPLGGLGSGTIGRGYRGEFCRFQMVPGIYHYHEVDADQFIVCIRKQGQTVYQKVLSCAKRSKKNCLKSWDWSFPADSATYHALYPRAWSLFKIPEYGITLVCRQISPVFPHDYLESSLPCASFIWEIRNDSDDDLDISITFTFKNGQGTKEDREGGVWCQGFSCACDGDKLVHGMTINQQFRGMSCSYGIAAKATIDVNVTTLQQFDPLGNGSQLWEMLGSTGQLHDDVSTEPTPPTSKGQEVASAVCVKTTVLQHSSGQCQFALAWDMPTIQFAAKENTYVRRYARLYGTQGNAAPQLCAHALRNFPMWESKIRKWQEPTLKSLDLPAWYKSALFNELYFISDGGAIWIDVGDTSTKAGTAHDVVKEYGRFGYLEGQEYRMYNTYDVHYYASFALLMLWPKLQLSLQYDYGDTVRMEDPERYKFLMSGETGLRKVRNCVPHDVGDPEDEPWQRVNCYNIHPTDDWKDLNLKFVLQVFRDFHATKNLAYLNHMYPICKCLIESSKVWDKDGDGLIENGGYADQTFDAWTMKGASSYCGGIWLASLRMMVEMARLVNQPEDLATFQSMLDKGKASFHEKLWNGSYYNYDTSSNGHHDSVMADQLAGHWFLKASGLQDDSIFPRENVLKALQMVYKNNVQGFRGGTMGAINGTRPDGKMDLTSPQSEEFWVGVVYGLAAVMVQEGMVEEGMKTAQGAHHTCWYLMGLHFQTPEAYTVNLDYRSLAYMRPLAIWAIQWAVEKFHPHMLVADDANGLDRSVGDKSFSTTDPSDQDNLSEKICDTLYTSIVEGDHILSVNEVSNSKHTTSNSVPAILSEVSEVSNCDTSPNEMSTCQNGDAMADSTSDPVVEDKEGMNTEPSNDEENNDTKAAEDGPEKCGNDTGGKESDKGKG